MQFAICIWMGPESVNYVGMHTGATCPMCGLLLNYFDHLLQLAVTLGFCLTELFQVGPGRTKRTVGSNSSSSRDCSTDSARALNNSRLRQWKVNKHRLMLLTQCNCGPAALLLLLLLHVCLRPRRWNLLVTSIICRRRCSSTIWRRCSSCSSCCLRFRAIDLQHNTTQ